MLLVMTSKESIIKQIQKHLDTYRDVNPLTKIQHLTIDEVSSIKGYALRSQKSQEQDYKRSWAKLAKAQRLNRLMLYHQKLTKDYQLNTEQQNQLKTLFYDGISSDLLDRDHIVYDVNDGTIIRLDGLKRDSDGIFYFDGSNTGAVTKLQTIKKFSPVSVSKLSIAQKKQRPVILIKKK